MIVVKTKATLRIKENKRNKLVPLGSVFRGRTIADLPEWLQEHITYFRNTSRCNTLLIREHAEIEQPIAPKGVEKVKTVVKEVKEADKPLPEVKFAPKIQPKDVVQPAVNVKEPMQEKPEDRPKPTKVPPKVFRKKRADKAPAKLKKRILK